MNTAIALTHRDQVHDFQQRHRIGLVTLVFTDIVGSTLLKQQYGDRAGVELIQRHHTLVRSLLRNFEHAEEISTAGDSFFLVFGRPSDAVRFSLLLQLRLRELARETCRPLFDRIGIHVGEVFIEEIAGHSKPKDLYGIQVDLCARLMSVGGANQIFMTRFAFDNARQVLKEHDIDGGAHLSWANHGHYLLKGVDEPIEICEVAIASETPLTPPATSEKAQRHVSPDIEPVLGWRPAIGQHVPNTHWVLQEKLGEGGFGEVWLARHQSLPEQRVFKFCFRADRVRSLKREVTLFRLLKEKIGQHPHIVHLQDLFLEEPPFYLMMEYVEGRDLHAWAARQGGLGKVPLAVRLEMIAQAAQALQAAHETGIIHRDVKPSNILVTSRTAHSAAHESGRTPRPEIAAKVVSDESEGELNDINDVQVKLTDFGIGQILSQEFLEGVTRQGFTQTLLSSSNPSLTGTQIYMAPELLAGQPASARSDIFSLGVVLYQMIVGDFTRPLTTDWTRQVQDPVLREDLAKCFAGQPEQRFESAAAFASNLRRYAARKKALAEQQAALSALEVDRAALAASERTVLRLTLMRAVAFASAMLIVAIILSRSALNMGQLAALARNRELEAEWHAYGLFQHLYCSDMNLVQQALEANNLGRAVELLKRNHRPPPPSNLERLEARLQQPVRRDLRDWEWRYFSGLCRSDELFTLAQLTNRIESIAFTRHGALVSVDFGDQVRLWDWQQRTLLASASLARHPMFVAISPVASIAAVASVDRSVKLYDFSSRTNLDLIATLTGHNSGVVQLDFSPDGKKIATLGTDGTARLWDVDSKKQIASFPIQELSSLLSGGIAYAPNGSRLAIGEQNGDVRILEIETGQTWHEFKGHKERISTLAFSPDGKTLASASWDHTVRIWDLEKRNLRATLTPHKAWVCSLAFSPDNQTLATAAADQTVRLWNVRTAEEVALLLGNLNEVSTVAFSPDGQFLATGCKDGSLKLWNATPKRREALNTRLPEELADSQQAFSLSSDAQRLLTISTSHKISIWNTTNASVPLRKMDLARLTAAQLSPNGQRVVTGTTDGVLAVWETDSGRKLGETKTGTEPLLFVQFTRDDRQIALSDRRELQLRNVSDLSLNKRLPVNVRALSALTLSPDGSFAVGGTIYGELEIWDLKAGRARIAYRAHRDTIGMIAFHPDSALFASCGDDQVVRIWRLVRKHRSVTDHGASERTEILERPELITTLKGALLAFNSVLFSPNGQRLIAGTFEGTVKVWDANLWQEVATLKGHDHPVYALAFSPDGNSLFSFSRDALIQRRAPSFAELDARERTLARP
ncbi:MAG: protein kinase [Verrucomicrobiota bacterium]